MPSQSAADETQAILIWRVGVAGRNYLLLERRRGMITIPGLRALGLREREPEVMVWVAAGKRNRDIGVILDMSERTVGKHVENILAKLGVESRMAATHYVIRAMHARARIGPAAL